MVHQHGDDEIGRLVERITKLAKLKRTTFASMAAFGLALFAVVYLLLKMFGVGRHCRVTRR